MNQFEDHRNFLHQKLKENGLDLIDFKYDFTVEAPPGAIGPAERFFKCWVKSTRGTKEVLITFPFNPVDDWKMDEASPEKAKVLKIIEDAKRELS